jgi:hypothetical protein
MAAVKVPQPPPAVLPVGPKPRLLDQVREAIRVRH